jgi:hypothetical protein
VGYLVVFLSFFCLDTTKLALFSGSGIRTREEKPIFTPNKRVKYDIEQPMNVQRV